MVKYHFKPFVPVFRITNMINASYYDLPKGFSYQEESHNFWELSYVDRGSIIGQQNGESYLVNAGEMLLCKPNVRHSCQIWQDAPTSVVDIEFYLEGTIPETFESRILILSEEEKQCMEAIVREAGQTYTHFQDAPPLAAPLSKLESAPYGSEQIICNRLEELLIYACRNDRNVHKSSRLLAPNPAGGRLSDWVESYIQMHYQKKLTLSQLAQVHNVSVTQLKRRFRVEVGSGVIEYMTDVRIREAKRFIRENNLSMSQIAEAVGFSNIHYFSTVFKKQTGMAPTEYARSVNKR